MLRRTPFRPTSAVQVIDLEYARIVDSASITLDYSAPDDGHGAETAALPARPHHLASGLWMPFAPSARRLCECL